MKISILDAATLGEDLSLSLFEQYGEVTVYASTPPEQVEALNRCILEVRFPARHMSDTAIPIDLLG